MMCILTMCLSYMNPATQLRRIFKPRSRCRSAHEGRILFVQIRRKTQIIDPLPDPTFCSAACEADHVTDRRYSQTFTNLERCNEVCTQNEKVDRLPNHRAIARTRASATQTGTERRFAQQRHALSNLVWVNNVAQALHRHAALAQIMRSTPERSEQPNMHRISERWTESAR